MSVADIQDSPAMNPREGREGHGLVSREAVSEFVLGAPRHTVTALGGVDAMGLRAALDAVEPEPSGRRALLARIAAAPTTEAIVEQAIVVLAETARLIWPIWFANVRFPCRDDALGRRAAALTARGAAREIAGVSPSWIELAVRLALADRPPRVGGALPAVEIAQLALAINRFGLVFAADIEAGGRDGNPAAMVRALEWIAQHMNGAVVALFPELPPNEPPFDRILYGARTVAAPNATEAAVVDAGPWIAPWRGLPHPSSEIEQRLARALGADVELATLFAFNQCVATVRGSRPKVDLVWTEGRLAIELDGWGSHGNRVAFMQDRQRDYELTISGYTVLRLTNDEIAQDLEKAIEKIRDLVTLCRGRVAREA
jgi:very-short-patch-repair endonuclease